MINGAWDVIILVIIQLWWVETKGKTLEEIDAALEGVKHSTVADLEEVRTRRAGMEGVRRGDVLGSADVGGRDDLDEDRKL